MKIKLEQAHRLLSQGHVVAVPTETVYGLAASLKHPKAIADIFSLKGRPSNNPLIIHLASVKDIHAYVHTFPNQFFALAHAFWPGPLTVVLDVIPDTIPEIVRAGLPTAAFRIPSHPLTQELLAKTGPLVMPSANLSGKPSATCSEHVEEDFGQHFPVLEGGTCAQGLESTILYWNKGFWEIIRLGAIAPGRFLPILGYCPQIRSFNAKSDKEPLCPGQLHKHYAPKAHLKPLSDGFDRLTSGCIIGFEDRQYPKTCRVLNLGLSTKPESAAQRLYALLRQLDQENIPEAWVDINLPQEGLWLTLLERLHKASQSARD